MHKSGKCCFFIAFAFLMQFLTACGADLPPARENFIGEWSSSEMQLVITRDGYVHYRRVEGKLSRSLSGPVKKFSDDGFEVGIMFFSTTFEVSKAPYKENGVWKMVVDGVTLLRRETKNAAVVDI